jgi:hypothetical protein
MHSPGLTVIELAVALALAAAAATLGAPRVVELARTVRLAGAARTVATLLRLARAQALARSEPVEVRLDAARHLLELRDRAGRPLARHVLPPSVALSGGPARGRVLFDGLGSAENATLVLAAGARERRVIVNQRGRVRLP